MKKYSDLNSEKEALVRLILDTQDESMLRQIKALFESQKTNWWDALPEEIKTSVERGLTQSKNGETVSHESVVATHVAKWLKR